MKKIFHIVIAAFVLLFFLGCDRMETAVDTYKKVKDDAHKKSQEAAQEEAGSIVNKKLKDKLGPSDSGENEKDVDDKDKNQ
jgi:hypothetical protein